MTPEDSLKSQREMTLPEFIDLAGDKLGVPKPLRDAIFEQESNFNHYYPNGQVKRSPKGALGVGQLMPDTAKKHGVDPLDPIDNAWGALKEQKELYDKNLTSTHDPNQAALLTAAAYNAGPAAVDKYGTIPPYAETQNYVKRVAQHLRQNPITQNVLSDQKPASPTNPASTTAVTARPTAPPEIEGLDVPAIDRSQAERLPIRQPPKVVLPDPFAMASVQRARGATYFPGDIPASNTPADLPTRGTAPAAPIEAAAPAPGQPGAQPSAPARRPAP